MSIHGAITTALLGLVVPVAMGCGAAPQPRPDTGAEPPISEAKYEAVLATAYVGLLADARDAARRVYPSEEAAAAAAKPFFEPRMDLRIRWAMRAHDVSEQDMMAFARMRQPFVRSQNRVHAERMRVLRVWAGRILSRVREISLDGGGAPHGRVAPRAAVSLR